MAFSRRSSIGIPAFASESILPLFPKTLIELEGIFVVLIPSLLRKEMSILYTPASLTPILYQFPPESTELEAYIRWASIFLNWKMPRKKIKNIFFNLLYINLLKWEIHVLKKVFLRSNFCRNCLYSQPRIR